MYRLIRWILPLFILLLYLAPFLLSTSWGSHLLLGGINRKIPGHIEADSLKLRWFSSQAVKNLKFYGKEGQLIFDVEEIRTELNLWNFLWGNFHFGQTHVMQPHLTLADKGSKEKQREESVGSRKRKRAKKQAVSGKFYLVEGTFLAQNTHLEKGALTAINGEATFTWPKKGEFTLSAETESRHGAGQLEGKGHFSHIKTKKPFNFKKTPPLNLEGKIALSAHRLPGPIAEALLQIISDKDSFESSLGDPLELNFEGGFTEGSGALLFNASSNTLTGSFHLGLNEWTLTLLNPAYLSFKGHLPFANAFLAPYNIRTAGGGHLEARCTQYVATWPKLLTPSALALSATTGPFNLVQEDLGLLQIEQSELDLSLPLNFKGKVIGSNFSLEGAFQKRDGNQSLYAKGDQLPMPWLDLFLPFPLTPYLGSSLNLEGKLVDALLTVSAQSPRLSLPQIQLAIANVTTLVQPNSFTYQLDIPFASQLIPVSGKLERLSLPLDLLSGAPFDPKTVSIEGQVEADEIALAGKTTRIKNFLLGIGGEHLSDGRFVLTSLILNDRLSPLGSNALPININGLFSLSEEPFLTLPRFRLGIEGANLNGLFVGSYTYPDTIGLLFPGECQLNLLPEVMPSLADPATLSLTLDPSPVIFSTTEPEKAHLVGKLLLPTLSLKRGEEMRDFKGTLLIDGSKNRGEVAFFGTTHSSKGEEGMLKGSCEIDPFPSPKRKSEGRIKLTADHFPLGIVSLFFPSIPFTEWIGPTLTVNANTQFKQLKPLVAEGQLRADSDLLTTDIGLKLEKTLSLFPKNRPAHLTWTATPNGFNSLYTFFKKTPPLSLNKPAILTTHLSALNLQKAPFAPFESSLALNASLTSLNLTRGSQNALLNNLALAVDAKNPGKGAYASIKGDLTTDQKGHFQLEAKGNALFSRGGVFQPKAAQYELKGRLNHLQTPILFDLSPLSEETVALLNALFGSAVTGNVQAKINHLSGPCSAQIESENSKLALDGRLKEGILFLNKPFTGSLRATPQLGRQLLKWVNPLLFTAFRSEKPILLKLDHKQFALPLFPFEPANISLERGELDIGNLWLTNQAPLSFFLGLFQGQSFPAEIMAISTPLYFHIENGQMTYERTDILFGKALHCAFWGRAQLPSLEARMNLAILPASLLNLLGLPGSPPPLIIPFKGKLTHLKADWKRAALGIAALAVKEQGKIGKVVGGAFDIASGKKKEEIPAPTTSPFPWE